MASSYTTSYGIEKIGSGEQSGAWGTTTNHNLDLLDRITAYTSVALSGTTHTLTVREASPGSGTENLQDGMYRVIKFTGALGGDNTVTIAPNTTKAFFILHNGTTDSGSSGPYSVILTQGSGANITVANGKNAIIYCDGGGSGAVVVDAVSNLALATVTASGDITSAGTVNVTGDTAAGDGASIGYTSAEGLILTGQGSTNDVTIKNDADADVITIATGATNVDVVGDLTAGTLNADSDTSAGDNATIGYTSAEGLILTGQGSTNDITIKNDADADVITIATGGTNVDIVGTVTASTVNADGDTSAGDNAAMGYTSAEGLILTGQGSTNDITIKNDADADVITIPTGTTGVVFAGNLKMTKGGDIASASPLVIDTDGNYFDVTGTTSFSVMTVEAGNFFMLQFDGALTITHGSGIELPGAANLTTAAGDRLICYATAANTVEVMNVATEAAASGGGLTSVQNFTSSGTWTKPTDITKVRVQQVGGGGGGAGSASSAGTAGSGAAGGYAEEFIDVSGTSSETVTIGAGGAGGAAGANAGSAGGTTSFGSLLSATGGAGGVTSQVNVPGAAGGIGSSGDINLTGGDGGAPASSDGDKYSAANGGASYFGGGGSGLNASNSSLSAANGDAPGSGGGGSGAQGATVAGGAGAAGIVIVWEYT